LIYVAGTIINSGYGLRRQVWDEATQQLKSVDDGLGFFRPPGTRSTRRSGTSPRSRAPSAAKRLILINADCGLTFA